METLDDRIARDGPVKELDAVGWAIRLAKRLEALHSLGVAHGSVSPACILTSGADRTSRAYIADVQLTASSLAFQSPERVLGGDLSPADDTWAVACTLYTALTGTSPFAGANDSETKQKILGGSPAPLAVFDVGDDDLQHIIDNALVRELGGRTSTVTALRRSLEEWHPDPGVGALSPLDDDDASEGDEDMRTVMRPAPAFLSAHKAAPAPAPTPAQAPLPDDDDDDDEDQATRMREFTLPPGLAAAAPFGGAAPYAPAAREAAPRPAAGRPHEGPSSPGFNAASAFGGPPAPHAPFGAAGLGPGANASPRGPGGGFGTAPMAAFGAAAPQQHAHDDDDDNENARTMMRTSPIDDMAHPSGLRAAGGSLLDEDDDDDGARTMMRDPAVDPWGTAPVDRSLHGPGRGAPAPAPFGGGAPPGPAPGWSREPGPAKTLALAGFELPAEFTSSAGSFPQSPNAGPPPGVSFGAPPGPAGAAGAAGPAGPGAFPAMGAPYGGPAVAPFQASPQAGPMMPMGQPVPGAAQLDAAAAAANSRRIVILTAAIALLVIAATTFVVLLVRGIK